MEVEHKELSSTKVPSGPGKDDFVLREVGLGLGIETNWRI